MSALDKITPMFLANAAFCIENGSDVKPEKRESIIDTLIKASEELSAAVRLAPAQGADAPLGWVWERCYSNGGYTRKFCALESEARELATDGEDLSHPDRVYPFFSRAQGADARPVASDSDALIRRMREKAYGANSRSVSSLKIDVSDLRALLDIATRDAAPTRYGYVYEWDYSPGVVHRSFDHAPYNGRKPDRTIEVFCAPREKT